MLAAARKLLAPNVAVDLGTANTRLVAGRKRRMRERPTVISSGAHPLRGGVIADIDGATEVLESLLHRTIWRSIFHPQVLACIPTDASTDERDALQTAITRSCASSVTFVPEPLAAAIGAGVEVWNPYAHMLVDFGEGVTDTAIIRGGEVVDSATLRIGCCDLR